MAEGFVKVSRRLLDNGIMGNGPAFQLFMFFLLSAAYQPHKHVVRGQVFELEPGQLVFSRAEAAAKLNLGEQQIRTALQLLKNLEIVTSSPTSKGTIISIINWDRYQNNQPAGNQQGNQPPNQQVTSSQPTGNQQEESHLKINKKERIKEFNINTASGDAEHPQNPDAPEPPEKPAGKKKPKKDTPPPDEPHYRAKSGRYLTGKRLESFDRFWSDFDFARGKAEAADAWLDIPQLTDALVARICEAARQEAADRPALMARGQTPKWAQGWINARRWEDYAPIKPRAPDKGQDSFDAFDEERWRKAQEMRRKLEEEKQARRAASG